MKNLLLTTPDNSLIFSSITSIFEIVIFYDRRKDIKLEYRRNISSLIHETIMESERQVNNQMNNDSTAGYLMNLPIFNFPMHGFIDKSIDKSLRSWR